MLISIYVTRKKVPAVGRRNKRYSKDLHQQAYEKLTGMQAFGQSKKEAVADGTEKDMIFSFNTYKTYFKHIKYFTKWIQEKYPECTTLKAARRHVNEWLQSRVDQVDEKGKHLSAWTIQTEAAALNKLYQIDKADPDRFQPPKRRKEDIIRSRGTKVRDRHFSEANNEELINFCKGVGPRRNVLEKMKGSDLYDRANVEAALVKAKAEDDVAMIKACTDALKTFPDQDFFVLHRRDKGGKTRISPIVGPHKGKIIARMQATGPDELVWRYVNSNCDVHGYRSDYATYIYKQYARPIENLRFENKIKCADGKYRSEIYVCRGSEAGKKLDRRAIGVISIALGHNREDTAISNYVRNL